MLVVFHASVQTVCYLERDWAAYSVQKIDCGSFAGALCSVVWSEKCYPSIIAR